MSQDEFIEFLRNHIAEHGTQQDFAERIGVTPAYVSDVLRGQRKPGKKLLDAMGFERIEMYQRKGGDSER